MAHTADNDKVTQQNVALGELINNATDPEVKRLISAYRIGEKYQKNLSVMTHSIFTSAMLEKTCEYLGIKTRTDTGTKVYKNKKLMGDRIILKIKACFPTCCDECSADYRNKKDDTPFFSCSICWQGSHNCAVLAEQKQCLDQVTSIPVGQAWLCHDCRKRNKLTPSNASQMVSEREEALTEDTETQPDITDETEETETDPTLPDDSEERHSPRRNMPAGTSEEADTSGAPNTRTTTICERYKKHQCPHGVSGKKEVDGRKCPYSHPRLCRAYVSNGTNARGGCKKGSNCKFLHPKLCRSSVRAKICTNPDCTFTHLKGTKRKSEQAPEGAGILKAEQFQLPRRNRSESMCSNISRKDVNTPMHAYFQRSEETKKKKVNQEDISFLIGMIEDMKGNQRELQQNVITLQQLMMPSTNQTQVNMLPRPQVPAAQQGPLLNPAQMQMPAQAPWCQWGNPTFAPPSFC